MMRVSTRRLSGRVSIIAALVVACVLGARAAGKRPVTFDDIMGMRAVGSAEIAPDGSAVLYTVRQWEAAAKQAADKEANKPARREARSRRKARRRSFESVAALCASRQTGQSAV